MTGLKKAVTPDDVTAALHTALKAIADNGYTITGCTVQRRRAPPYDDVLEHLDMIFRVRYVRPR